MITIKILKEKDTFIMSDRDAKIVRELCYRLQDLWHREANDLDGGS
jgi:hypothetical protein